MKAQGHVFKYGDNIDTDIIIPARYLNTADSKELAAHCMEPIDAEFYKNAQAGDIMVGGKHASCSAETCCESFTEKKGDSFKSAVEHPSEYISIDCEAAKCMYNENYKCTASRVDIRGCGACDCKETACATFDGK